MRDMIAAPVRWLRRRPLLFWFAVLLYICIGLGAWIAAVQPTNGRMLEAGQLVSLALWIVGLFYLLAFDFDSDTARAMGAKLSKSKWTGILIALTTFVILFFAAEAYLRIFYITTDGYGFTAMNYWWYQNFGYGHDNSLGFRDYEPKTDDGLTRVAIVGDSFAMGHGINNIDDTFPQLLERRLGEGYDVNVIAESGWDTNIAMFQLDSYPYRPNIVVLSYYLNDIDYLLDAPETNPDSRFTFPDNEALSWFILNFFVPNYIYYNLLQFTSTERTSNHLFDLVNAHLDEANWSQQAQRLYEITLWARDHDARLIALLWPHITAVEASQPAITRLRDFFTEQGVTFVDMSEPLLANPSPALIVNRFDTHPGLEAQRLAADALYEAITAP